jgi:hypothetical protein
MALPSSSRDRELAKFVQSPTRSEGSAIEVVGNLSTASSQFSTLIDEASSSVIYIGEAVPGSATSAALWLIKKINITGGFVSILCANGSSDYNQIWDDRSSLTYV